MVCPLSDSDWVTFLDNEINNLERSKSQEFSSYSPFLALLLAGIVAIINWTLINPPQDKEILNHLKSTYTIFVIVFIFFVLLFSIRVFSLFRPASTKINRLKDIRNKIIDEELIGSNVIREKWKNIMQPNYEEVFGFDFFSFRFSISRKE